MKKNIFLLMLAFCLVVTGSVFAQDKRTDVTIITQVSPDSLDPSVSVMSYAYSVIVNISETLMTTDAQDNLIPGLAESVEVNDDASEFVFKLREGVKFHDGEVLTAEDVKASMEFAREQQSFTASYSNFWESIEVIDDLTFNVTTKEVYAKTLIDMGSHYVLPKKLIEEGHDFNADPVGTGPYKFVRRLSRNTKLPTTSSPPKM